MRPLLALPLLSLLLPLPALALTGLEIATKADLNNQQYKGQRAETTMTLYGPNGEKTIAYKMMQLTKEGNAKTAGPKSLIRFTDPPDTKGTALLTHEAIRGDDDRWLYLSESRQTKRISGGNKSASFKGSELSYEDLSLTVVPRYEWKLLGEKNVNGVDAFEVERTAKFEASGYKRSIVYFHKEHFYPVQVRYFDLAGQPLKVSNFKDYKQYDGKWRAHHAEVVNVQTKRKTVLEAPKYELGVELPDGLFTTANLAK